MVQDHGEEIPEINMLLYLLPKNQSSIVRLWGFVDKHILKVRGFFQYLNVYTF